MGWPAGAPLPRLAAQRSKAAPFRKKGRQWRTSFRDGALLWRAQRMACWFLDAGMASVDGQFRVAGTGRRFEHAAQRYTFFAARLCVSSCARLTPRLASVESLALVTDTGRRPLNDSRRAFRSASSRPAVWSTRCKCKPTTVPESRNTP